MSDNPNSTYQLLMLVRAMDPEWVPLIFRTLATHYPVALGGAMDRAVLDQRCSLSDPTGAAMWSATVREWTPGITHASADAGHRPQSLRSGLLDGPQDGQAAPAGRCQSRKRYQGSHDWCRFAARHAGLHQGRRTGDRWNDDGNACTPCCPAAVDVHPDPCPVHDADKGWRTCPVASVGPTGLPLPCERPDGHGGSHLGTWEGSNWRWTPSTEELRHRERRDPDRVSD